MKALYLEALVAIAASFSVLMAGAWVGAAADRQFRLGRWGLALFARPGRRRRRLVAGREAAKRGPANLHVVTSDVNLFAPEARYDLEMFEHMTNWRELMTRVGACLKPDGRLFLRGRQRVGR